MMKPGEFIVVVESVKDAVKFYTEKLAFDVIRLDFSNDGINGSLTGACLKKGKTFIHFRNPVVDELAEFSFIKRCASRCVGFSLPFKKGIDRYYNRCNRKGVKIVQELQASQNNEYGPGRSFVMRDIYGTRIVVFEPIKGSTESKKQQLTALAVSSQSSQDDINNTIIKLKRLGVLRRSAKKYIKQLLKN